MSVELLVIGYGNSLRRDDGAGLLLAETLTAIWQAAGHAVTLVTAHQLMPELAAEIAESQAQVILLIDTAITPSNLLPDLPPAQEVDALHGHSGAVPSPTSFRVGAVRLTRLDSAGASATLGHHLDPAALLLYAAHLYDAHPAAWLLQVPGYDFDHGEGLSPQTRAAVDQAAAAANLLWARLCDPQTL